MLTKKELIAELRKNLQEDYAIELEDATSEEIFFSLGSAIKGISNQKWQKTWKNYLKEQQKQVYYFSIEFLPGKLLKSNLLNLGLYELVKETLADLTIDLEEIVEQENVIYAVFCINDRDHKDVSIVISDFLKEKSNRIL